MNRYLLLSWLGILATAAFLAGFVVLTTSHAPLNDQGCAGLCCALAWRTTRAALRRVG